MARKRKVLGRGMSQLVDGSLSSIVESANSAPPSRRTKRGRPASRKQSAQALPKRQPQPTKGTPRPALATAPRISHPLNVVSISSGKGGTGKSILTSNLAVLLAAENRVTILDADLGLANIHILYNLMPRYNASHVISGEKTLEEVLVEGPRGVHIIPGGSGVPELANLSDMMFGSFADGIASLEETSDLLLIDAPGGIDRQALTFLLASDQVLVVTTEDITAMTDAYAVVKTLLTRRPGAHVVIVVNLARSYAEGMETFQKVAQVVRRFLGRELALGGIIPLDETVEQSVAERVPVTISHPASPAARAIVSIAGRVATFHERSRPTSTSFITRLKELLRAAPAGGV
jgi:flagellar biosynthesis protein FlhG